MHYSDLIFILSLAINRRRRHPVFGLSIYPYLSSVIVNVSQSLLTWLTILTIIIFKSTKAKVVCDHMLNVCEYGISQLTNLCTGIRSQPPPISRHPFRCSFGCVLLLNQIYLVHNVPFDNITPIYLINLPWKLGLGLRLDLKMHYFTIFHGE